MRVKRYVVDSMPDALQRIRVELGKDAVILNTKEIKSGGFLGFFSKKRIEVIAATDNTVSAPRQSPQIPIIQPTSPSPVYESPAPLAAVRAPNIESLIHTTTRVLEQPVMSEQRTEPKPIIQPAHEIIEPRTKEKDDILIDEVRQVKELFLRFSTKDNIMNSPEPFQVIQRRLLEQEIEPNIVDTLITNALAEQATPGYQWTEQEAAKSIRMGLYEILHNDVQKTMSRDVQVVHFVGPTGVGKTTTIAKLAAEQVLKYNRKVGFITSDTYRIAAIEQLKTYATILNIPLEVVFSPARISKNL